MAQFTSIGGKLVKLTASDSETFPRTLGIMCGTAGTATITDSDGNICTDFPLQEGYNPISITKWATGGTADNVWAIYERQ